MLLDLITGLPSYLPGLRNDLDILTCSLDKAISVIKISDGIELKSLVDKGPQDFIGILSLASGARIEVKDLPQGDFLFGQVLMGRVGIQGLGVQRILSQKTFFRVSKSVPWEFWNTSLTCPCSVLIYVALLTEPLVTR